MSGGYGITRFPVDRPSVAAIARGGAMAAPPIRPQRQGSRRRPMDTWDRPRPLPQMRRRAFLKAAGAATAAAGMEGILAAGRAPARAQATKIHLLQWVDFIPEGDVEIRRQVAEYNKQMKVEV